MKRLLFILMLAASLSQAGMLFFRVDSTDYGRLLDSAFLDKAAGEILGFRNANGDPVMTDDNFAITYTDDSGAVWACPGNGHASIGPEFVAALIERYGFTANDVFWRPPGQTQGLTLVVPEIGP